MNIEYDLLHYFYYYSLSFYPEWILEGEAETVHGHRPGYSNAGNSHIWYLLQRLDSSHFLCSHMVDRR